MIEVLESHLKEVGSRKIRVTDPSNEPGHGGYNDGYWDGLTDGEIRFANELLNSFFFTEPAASGDNITE